MTYSNITEVTGTAWELEEVRHSIGVGENKTLLRVSMNPPRALNIELTYSDSSVTAKNALEIGADETKSLIAALSAMVDRIENQHKVDDNA